MNRASALTALVAVPVLVGSGLTGVGAAVAAPSCADYTFIGVAGSGEGAEAGGMGTLVSNVVSDLAQRARAKGKTVATRAVRYPALPVPQTVETVGPFLQSMETGARNTQGDIGIVARGCPSTKIVVVGYSQGAAAAHRALQRTANGKQIAAAALIADPDRRPGDTARSGGSASGGQGLARAVPIGGALPQALPVPIGAHTLSWCNAGDGICDWTGSMDDAKSSVHTSYTAAPIAAGLAPLAGL
ncbi:cutinase family protein [Tsukamurella sp. 8F]|uniref:cutinase family protein n=1 Tax=unclassified Tsukamurella TaxID=2633480 RepID=UPI0023B8F791|nr:MULTISPECIES: cutinase family protein [unclassified Tsukamurella]MDF0529949.1 cutinase family protein [Tsukamurella sp. 8J]MDF0587279.1 cutinase family protein [Tsukamurella sp. 8F]